MLECAWISEAGQVNTTKRSMRGYCTQILLLIKNFQLRSAGKCPEEVLPNTYKFLFFSGHLLTAAFS